MTTPDSTSSRFVLPLPSVILHPLTAVAVALLHIYLSVEHLSKLFRGEGVWTDIWKGFGALVAAYIFAALASRALARSSTLLRDPGRNDGLSESW